MLKVVEISGTVILGAASIFFMLRAIGNGFYTLLHHYDRTAEEHIRAAKRTAQYMSLFGVTGFIAVSIPLHEYALLLILPLFLAGIWLDYAIQRAMILRTHRH